MPALPVDAIVVIVEYTVVSVTVTVWAEDVAAWYVAVARNSAI